jgi:hypothetical protein
MSPIQRGELENIVNAHIAAIVVLSRHLKWIKSSLVVGQKPRSYPEQQSTIRYKIMLSEMVTLNQPPAHEPNNRNREEVVNTAAKDILPRISVFQVDYQLDKRKFRMTSSSATTQPPQPVISSRLVSILLLAVLTCEIVLLCLAAQRKLFWDDELLTLHISSLRPFPIMWRALESGVDAMTPAYYGLVVLARTLPGDISILLRLSSLIGYILSLLGVYWFTRKRFPPVAALSAALVISLLPYRQYAIEARSYAMLVGLLAISAALWQRVDEEWWAKPLFFVCLTLAVAMHHLAVVSLLSFGMAELVFVRSSRRVRWNVWTMLLMATFPFLLSLPLSMHIKAVQGSHFWASTWWGMVFTTYGNIFNVDVHLALVGVAMFGLALIGVIWGLWYSPCQSQSKNGFQPPEVVLIGGLLIYPAVLVILAKVAGSVYTARYGLPAILAFALTLVFLLGDIWTKPTATRLLAALLLVFLYQAGTDVRFRFRYHPKPEDNWSGITRFCIANPGIPVAVDSGDAYLQIMYYASPELTKRLVRVVNPEAAVRWTGTDTSEIGYLLFRQFFPWRIEESERFLTVHKKFFVLLDGSNFTVFTWLRQYLLEKKYHLTLVWQDNSSSIWLAEK